MKQNETNLVPKSSEKFHCEKCNYNTSRNSQYIRHLSTHKHKMKQNETNGLQKVPLHICSVCNMEFNSRSTLWRHKSKCTTEIKYSPNTMELLLQENKDMKQMIMEMMGKMGNTTNNITNNNQQNNQFNINMFLNETCKDAINFSDFIDRIEISHDDLENNAQLGFVNGITKILMDNLKLLTLHERPIHCTDVKRETMYIKDENKWNKDHSVEILENAIKEVSRKSMQSLSHWKKNNPDYEDMDSEFSKKCIPMQQNSMGLCNKSSFYPKIIHNLAKENAICHLK
jgi:hypothetical protein